MELTAERLRSLLDYDPATDEFTWRLSRYSGRVGTRAGTITKKGARQIKIDQVIYSCARLAVLWTTGQWPKEPGPLTAKRLRELLDYEPATGEFIWRFKHGRRGHHGAKAGVIDPSVGYRRITIDGEDYRCHRLAVLYMTGKWPETGVDHRNRDKSDDRWENLRLANQSQNCANSRARGPYLKGVSWDRQNGRFVAQIGVNRRNVFLGRFDDPEAAHAAYVAAAAEHFGPFARSS